MMNLEKRLYRHIDLLVKRYPGLEMIKQSVTDAYLIMQETFSRDGKLLIAGNGGSAADAEHITGELMKKFKISRTVTPEYARKLKNIDSVIGSELAGKLERGLMTIPLTTHEALMTAYMNDADSSGIYAQQLFAYGRAGDVFLAISTSGNSQNILKAAVAAKASGIKIIALTGADGGRLAASADIAVRVPETETYMIQELHLPVYHCWCMMLEDYFFGGDNE